MDMKNIFLFLLICINVSCVPSQTRRELTDLDRDRFWRFCHFIVIDRQCGFIDNVDQQTECANHLRNDYNRLPRIQYRPWLRNHGCPASVIETADNGRRRMY